MRLATPIPLEQLCRLAQVSRAGYYRWQNALPAIDRDMDLRDEIQRIALEFPSYGWPRIPAELKRRGWGTNHKRVYRIMREDNLLCLRRRKFMVTTNSNHDRPVYPNLTRGMVLTGIDQLWIADITYIRLETEFVYLAVVLDAYSRRVIGWALDRTLEDKLTLAALQMALERRIPAPGLVHHSDRGIQYASQAYTDLLKQREITISMSRKGNPYGSGANASAQGDDEKMQRFVPIENLFKGRHFDGEIIILCVSWYTSFKLSLRDLVSMMADRGISMTHTTILRWAQRYLPEFEKRWRR